MKSGDLVRIKKYMINHGGQSAGFRRVLEESDGVFACISAETLLGRIGVVLRESYYYRNGSYNVAFGEDIIVSHKSYFEKITKD